MYMYFSHVLYLYCTSQLASFPGYSHLGRSLGMRLYYESVCIICVSVCLVFLQALRTHDNPRNNISAQHWLYMYSSVCTYLYTGFICNFPQRPPPPIKKKSIKILKQHMLRTLILLQYGFRINLRDHKNQDVPHTLS